LSENLPAQVHSPGAAVATRAPESEGLDQNDILIPRMKIGQKTSRDVLEYGGIYVLESRDTEEPVQLAAPPAAGGAPGEAVRFYVLGDPVKGWSWRPKVEGGEWRGDVYPDLALVEDNDPRKVRRTYDYTLTLPAYPMLFVRFIMHGAWGGQAAKQINTQLLLNRQRGVESHTVAFKLQARKTKSPQGGQDRPFIQAVVGLDKVKAADKATDLELVESHLALVGQSANLRTVDDDDTATAATATAAPPLD
jgi:hypothetical protein